MRVRTFFVLCCVFALACQSLFGNLSEQNPEYCSVDNNTCMPGTHCDVALHRCISDNLVDGGNDGGPSANPGFELFASNLIPISLYSAGMPSEESVLYRGDFDGNGIADIFMMGLKRYAKVMNPASGPPTINFGSYLQVGQNPEATAIGRLDGDAKDDIAIALAGSVNYIELQLSGDAQPKRIDLTEEPRGVAIGDFNGDNKNDIAVGFRSGSVSIYAAKDDGGYQLGATIPADAGLPNSVLVSMAVPGYRKLGTGYQDLVYTLRSDPMSMDSSKIRVVRFGNNLSFTIDNRNVSSVPTELVIGHFLNETSYDAVLVTGTSELNLITDIEKSNLALQQISLSTYYVDFHPPDKGKIAVGRLLDASIANQLDDLVVLHADGFVSVFAGGTNWKAGLPKIANRSLIGEHVVVGRFAINSQRDDIATVRDTDLGATLSIARNLGGSSANLMLPYDLRGSSTTSPKSIVVTGSFGSAGSSDFAIAGGGSNTVLRCGPDGNQGVSCTGTQPVSAAIVAAAALQCPGKSTQLLAAYDNKNVVAIDLGAGGGPRVLATAPFVIEQLELGDLNNDGSPDLVARSGTGDLSFLMGQETQPCTFRNMFVTPGSVIQGLSPPLSRKVLVTDVNLDGITDLVLGEQKQLGVYLGSSARLLGGSMSTLAFTGDLIDIAIGDFRGQGQRELVVASAMGAGTQITWAQLSPGGLSVSASTSLAMPTKQLLAADLDRDGRAEVLALHGERRALSVISGSSPNTAGVRSYALGLTPNVMAIGQLLGNDSSPLDVIVADTGIRRDSINGSQWILEGRSGLGGSL